MIYAVQEFVELVYWKLQAVLDKEGITMLQWAFMQRALLRKDGVPFKGILSATGEPKDNVRRAAESLGDFANIVVDPKDRRCRRLLLTKRGRKRAKFVMMRLEKEMLNLLGARDYDSVRAANFQIHLMRAMAYLAPGDLASEETIARSRENREAIPDDSLRFVEDDSNSRWTDEEPPEDFIPW